MLDKALEQRVAELEKRVAELETHQAQPATGMTTSFIKASELLKQEQEK